MVATLLLSGSVFKPGRCEPDTSYAVLNMKVVPATLTFSQSICWYFESANWEKCASSGQCSKCPKALYFKIYEEKRNIDFGSINPLYISSFFLIAISSTILLLVSFTNNINAIYPGN